MMRFENKIILITGAARGIGFATAELFAKEGGIVIATDVDSGEVNAAVAQSNTRGLAMEGRTLDVTDPDSWQQVISEVLEKYQRLDILINNAGLNEVATIEETSFLQWKRVMSVNLDGVFHGMQAAIAVMKESGGVIVNVASITADVDHCGRRLSGIDRLRHVESSREPTLQDRRCGLRTTWL